MSASKKTKNFDRAGVNDVTVVEQAAVAEPDTEKADS